jgi:asparagine synthase (glutamine-hydrolysing)
MCGIFGMVCLRGAPLRTPGTVEAMGAALRHRGPDSHGVASPAASVAMGCERLRIIDLRHRADQPFQDPDGRILLACNGEIYNSDEIRRRYPDYPYRSRSDVETILPLYLDKGWQGLEDLDGMYGLAIWNRGDGSLVLARDRAGEKPLFYARLGDELWFASEVQALLLDAAVSRELDETALGQFLALGYVPEPRSAFRDVEKIGAGTIVRFTAEGRQTRRYWSFPAEAGNGNLRTALPELREMLRRAVCKQMVADVPVGIFLSGGVDSSLMAAIAARETHEQLHTFTARFAEHSYDESAAAAAFARSLGADHYEILIDETTLREAVAAVTDKLAEPLADPAILPTYLVAREARRHVTVILSGEGADELFGGYPTYLGHRLAGRYAALPGALRRLLQAGVERLPASRRKVTLEFLLKRFVADAGKPWLERHLAWFGTGAHHLLIGGAGPGGALADLDLAELAAGATGAGGAMRLDYNTYLRDGLLVKNDRACMLNSLEGRAPFLGRDMSAFALALPERFKVRGLTTKWLLKKAALEWLPRSVVYRKKRGLSVPVASWIDGGLRSEVDRLLDPARLARQELLDPARVGALLAEHRAGYANHARPLWAVVVLQYFLDRWAPARAEGR